MTYTSHEPYPFIRKGFDATHEAKSILYAHTAAFISGIHYEPETADELCCTISEECGFILTERWLEGYYNPIEYNAVRNELARLIDERFQVIPWNVMDWPINN